MDYLYDLLAEELGLEPPNPCDGCGDYDPHTDNCISNGGCGRISDVSDESKAENL